MRAWSLLALVLVGCAGGATDEATDDTDVGETDGGDTDTVDDTDPTGDTDVATACAPAATFLDVSAAPGAGDGYDAPSVEVSCGAETWTVVLTQSATAQEYLTW